MRIRDAVIGDIILNDWEEAFVRTPSFQRLHRIKQLGNAFHVYPSAMHTRFEHSLGVCHQIKKLFAQPRFFGSAASPDEEEKRIVQLAGLLHDIVHTPFKHTLERDTGIIPKEPIASDYGYWTDKIWAEGNTLKQEVKATIKDSLLEILTTKEHHKLREPYKRQIIEDTLSADLLDYSRRDAFFTTGAIRQWDERVYDHIALAPYTSKPFLVARITDEEGEEAESAITELTNLLQIRYILNERVYFYPVKIAADSLLAKSVRCLLASGKMKVKQFREVSKPLSDEELLNYLASRTDTPEAASYARCLINRQLPRLAQLFRCGELAEHQEEYIGQCFRGPENLEKWQEYESKIASLAGVDKGSIIIYCHDRAMQKKEPDFLVEDKGGELKNLKAHRMWTEIEGIARKHQLLWRCYVFSLERQKESLEKVKKAADEVFRTL